MSRPYATRPDNDEAKARPMYARVLRLHHFQPSGMVSFILFEGSVAAALILALAELVSWWGLIALPVAVALLVKVNDVIAGAVARSADRIPQRERDRFEREVRPAIGRASVPGFGPRPGARATVPVSPTPAGVAAPAAAGRGGGAGAADQRVPGGVAGRRGTVYASSARSDQAGHGDGWGWHGEQPEWRPDQSGREQAAWHGQRQEWGGEPPDLAGGEPQWRGDQPEWRGDQPPWRGDQLSWPGPQPGWPAGERG